MTRLRSPLLALAVSLLLAACATQAPPAAPLPEAPAAWRAAPLPHGGSQDALARWWERFEDPHLQPLLREAQARSPELALAAARLRQARAESAQARAALLPQLQAQAQASRGSSAASAFAPSSLAQGQLALQWELDLFGAQRAQGQAAALQAQAAAARWHDARVSLAADVASAYLQLRHAQAQEEIAELDVRLATQQRVWGEQQQRVGLASGSDVALLATLQAAAEASRVAQRADAQVALQHLATLTGLDATPLAERLAAPPVENRLPQRRVPSAPAFAAQTLPAALLAQRPDLAAAHRQWLAAVQAEAAVRAQDWPQLSLGALAGRARLQAGGSTASGTVWSLAPSLSLPLFDGGLRSAAKEGAAGRRDEAAAALQQRWREAVGEVENAMQRLHAAAERQRQAEGSIEHWLRLVNDAELLGQAGLQSGPQRAQTQRQALAGYSAAQAVRAEHALAWVQLYRTLGGGWNEADATP